MTNKELSQLEPNISVIWASLQETYHRYAQQDSKLLFKDNLFGEFREKFLSLYDTISDGYMRSSVLELDRHKIAAITIVAAIETHIIEYKSKLYNKVFIGSEMIAAEVAFLWMRRSFNEKLKEFNISVKEYHMPRAFACPTPYFEIFCRNLYFAHDKFKLNPLDIAEKLYLLEYITLLKDGIDPLMLQYDESKKEGNDE